MLQTITDAEDEPGYLALHQRGSNPGPYPNSWTIDCYIDMPTLVGEQFEVYHITSQSVEYPVSCPLNWLLA